jgi:hypothetical protein
LNGIALEEPSPLPSSPPQARFSQPTIEKLEGSPFQRSIVSFSPPPPAPTLICWPSSKPQCPPSNEFAPALGWAFCDGEEPKSKGWVDEAKRSVVGERRTEDGLNMIEDGESAMKGAEEAGSLAKGAGAEEEE